ncbi:MAG: hypothetical protein ABI273_12310 [Lacunisphaera sp.]
MKTRIWIIGLILLASVIHANARLGETEAELTARFGPPAGRSKHIIVAQGKIFEMGPTFNFRQKDWSISCDLVDGKCMRISYSKQGDWSEDQIKLVLSANNQGATWTETSKPAIADLQRTWKRSDGSIATWQLASGMTLVWQAYEVAKATVEERAKVAAKAKPKI